MGTHQIIILASFIVLLISSVVTTSKVNLFYLGIAIFVLSFLI